MKRIFSAVAAILITTTSIASENVKATFKADKQSGPLPLSVAFKGLDENPSVSYKWDFGNGSTSLRKEATTMFVNPGTYTVKLVVTNNNQVDSSFMTINVLPNPDLFKSYKEKVSLED